ncbi:MAG: hypothetical protein M1834_005858 [Cirrosporium novae-zelandiae]|nr:MAG: hypothetical protein M1834_005858 [Cirrosporium novae-zelandiae]
MSALTSSDGRGGNTKKARQQKRSMGMMPVIGIKYAEKDKRGAGYDGRKGGEKRNVPSPWRNVSETVGKSGIHSAYMDRDKSTSICYGSYEGSDNEQWLQPEGTNI